MRSSTLSSREGEGGDDEAERACEEQEVGRRETPLDEEAGCRFDVVTKSGVGRKTSTDGAGDEGGENISEAVVQTNV